MTNRQWSVADHFAEVLAELNKAKDSYTIDDPLRYPVSMLVRAADKAMYDGIITAKEILESIKCLREKLKEEA